MAPAPQVLLVIDDNTSLSEALAELLAFQGRKVFTAATVNEAHAQIDAHAPDVIILDLGLPGADGTSLVREIRARSDGKAPTIVVWTGHHRFMDAARTDGCDACVLKPDVDGLLHALSEATAARASLAGSRSRGGVR